MFAFPLRRKDPLDGVGNGEDSLAHYNFSMLLKTQNICAEPDMVRLRNCTSTKRIRFPKINVGERSP
jgi:hypothetical protein